MSDTGPEQQVGTPPSYTATSPTYVVNALELPANQAAAAMFLNTSPYALSITSTTLWADSPLRQPTAGNTGGQSSFVDLTTATRKTNAQAALNAENTRLTNVATATTNQQTAIANLLAL